MAETTQARTVVARCPLCTTLNRIDLSRIGDRPKCAQCGKPILLDRPIAVTDADFDRVIAGSEIPILVDCYADWCGPCKMMAPVLDAIAHEQVGRVLVAKLDTDRNPVVAERLGIQGIPTFIVFSGGTEVARQVGGVPKPRLEQMLASAGP